MKRALKHLLFLVVCIPWMSRAQIILPFDFKADEKIKHEIRFIGGSYLHSTSLPNYFTNHFFNGSSFDTTELNRFDERLKRVNRLGFEISSEVEYRFSGVMIKKYPNLGFMFRAGHHTVGGAGFTRDLFNLAFRGNSPYAGQTLQLAPSGMDVTTYQTIGVGAFNKKKDAYAVLNFVKGQSFYDFRLKQGDFFTDSLGQYLSFDYQAEVNRSDSSRNRFSQSNGWGVCTDVFFSFKIPLDSVFEDVSQWFVQVHNFGFIRWSNHSLAFTHDSIVQYQGFEVGNLFDPGNNFLSGETDLKDSVQLKYQSQAWTQILPATIVIGNYVDPLNGNRIKPTLGFRYRFVEYYKPMLLIGFTYKLWKNAYTSVQVQTGGFGNWRMGLRLSLPFLFKGNLVIGSNHFIGLLSSQASGRDVYAGLRIRF